MVMFVRVTLPQLVTTPLTRLPWPSATLSQFFVTAMHGASVTTHTLVACAIIGAPQIVLPDAVTIFVFPPQVAVTILVYVKDPPGTSVTPLVMGPTILSLTEMFVIVTLPQLVT